MPQRIFTTKLLRVDGMTCANCESRIENELKKIKGISQINASYGDGTLKVVYDEMAVDVHAPEKYDIWQSVGDTTGPGGILRALRTRAHFVYKLKEPFHGNEERLF